MHNECSEVFDMWRTVRAPFPSCSSSLPQLILTSVLADYAAIRPTASHPSFHELTPQSLSPGAPWLAHPHPFTVHFWHSVQLYLAMLQTRQSCSKLSSQSEYRWTTTPEPHEHNFDAHGWSKGWYMLQHLYPSRESRYTGRFFHLLILFALHHSFSSPPLARPSTSLIHIQSLQHHAVWTAP